MEGVDQVIKDVWCEDDKGGYRKDCFLRNKLKKTKTTLRSKSLQKFGNLEGEIDALKTMASALELKAENGIINEVERNQWLNARKEWFQKEKIKVNMLKQKARVRWILEGDENSRYFHSVIKRGYNKNNIRGLLINGVWCEDPLAIKDEAYSHFKSRFEESPGFRPSLIDLSYPTLSPDEANDLETPILESEVLEAIHDCGSSKAPGPDGFNLRFFKKFWDIIKEDVLNAISWFWEKGEFSKGCNASFVTLSPKKSDPITLSDYRPISLISSYYKIVAKILSNRLRKVIPKLIGSEQSAFLRERYILDGVLIANESIDFLKIHKKRSLIFKVDFEKAFDSLNWDFLLEVMSCMGFGTRWCDWIRGCLKSASISVLINGSPTREFSMGRGVRQGDPLSPFLFILAAEGLNILTKAAVDRGIFKGVEIGNDKVTISHLQYADDTIFFGEWSNSNASNLIKILKCFELASGLKVNFLKSCLYGIGVGANEIESLASRMKCQAGSFPFTYLGLPIGARMKRIGDWSPVIDKFIKRLSEWKRRTLSFGGRLVLVKSVLNSLPLYFFALFRAPPCVLNLLESVRRNFFWGGDLSGSKISWVKWSITCLPYGAGGLNIGSLKGKNLALLGKWWWRFKTETHCLWTKIIRSIYGIDGGLRSGDGLARQSTLGIWNNIIIAGNSLEGCDIAFRNSFSKSIGDGKNTSFWNDNWCGSSCFKDMFPRLFMLESNKNAMLSDRVKKVAVSVNTSMQAAATHGFRSGATSFQCAAALGSEPAAPECISGLDGANRPIRSHCPSVFVPSVQVVTEAPISESVSARPHHPGAVVYKTNWEWSRLPTGRTAGELTDLENLINSIHFDFNSGEKWKWSLANDGIFTVKRLSTLIDNHILGHHPSLTETLRNNLIPKKIEIFIWRVLKKRIPVRVELDKRGIDLHSVRCPICDDGLETVDHSLVSCKFASEVWVRIYNWWNMGSCTFSSVESLKGSITQASSSLGKKIWQGVMWVCAYYLWKNRNMKAFRNEEWCVPVIVNEIQVKAFEWISCRLRGRNIDWSSWLVNPHVFLNL
ncbi:uncharacterized protein [Rutidosis leptorrhynchoides]|uniref:uncharacterized protein n=1 Tax=Rutidosis leptorrhynchoides TaxID=125765 RepID=UPI003A99BCD6